MAEIRNLRLVIDVSGKIVGLQQFVEPMYVGEDGEWLDVEQITLEELDAQP